MPKEREYEVEVVRTAYASQTFRVKARNVTEARAKALEIAPNEVFSEDDAEYKSGSVSQVEDSAD
jgi:hypothetical protein